MMMKVLLFLSMMAHTAVASFNIAIAYNLADSNVLCTPAARAVLTGISHQCAADTVDSTIGTSSNWGETDQARLAPTSAPSAEPSVAPSDAPSAKPSDAPSALPSSMPSAQPSAMPSALPSAMPSALPSAVPSKAPSPAPTLGGARRRLLEKQQELEELFASTIPGAQAERRLNCYGYTLCMAGALDYCDDCSCCGSGRRNLRATTTVASHGHRQLTNTVVALKNCVTALVISHEDLGCIDDASVEVTIQVV